MEALLPVIIGVCCGGFFAGALAYLGLTGRTKREGERDNTEARASGMARSNGKNRRVKGGR